MLAGAHSRTFELGFGTTKATLAEEIPVRSFEKQKLDQNDNPTVGQNRKKHRINSRQIIHFPMSKGVRKVSEQAIE